LNKLRVFQELGHNIILIIGDYTAMIGDPSGRSSERPALTREEVEKNVSAYKAQVAKVLDVNKMKVVYNSGWFSKMGFDETVKLISKFTLAQMLEHETFGNRLKNNEPLGFHELLYPVMQGYDSVMIEADVELGGTDQRFNVIAGRYLQKASGMEPQAGLFTPILAGLDGKNKMSKSLGNYIGLNDRPEDIYGKVMSIPDTLIIQYFELLTDAPDEEIEEVKKGMEAGGNPMDFKKRLAYAITGKYTGADGARYGAGHFERAFSGGDIPYEEHPFEWDFPGEEVTIAELFKKTGSASSNSEARRIVEQGGFYLNGGRVDDFSMTIKKADMPFTFKTGKKRFGIFRQP
ncbi:MAG TPA: tyrosine--tRNA ligase, partial [bacterium]|nr:tyrosine--tRNA ligase [bacterium]